MGIDISVIIPVYNMQEYIGDCIDSVMKQSLRTIEVICVDDGSTDDTRKVIQQKRCYYNNLIYYYQNNRGSGVARNLGMQNAEGEYIAFMDADDFYPHEDVLEKLLYAARANCVELCGGSACMCSDSKINFGKMRSGMVFDEEKIILSKDYNAFYGYWRFIYKRDFLIEYGIRFPNYMRNQDPPFFLRVLAFAQKFYALPMYTYCYRKNHKSVEFNLQKSLDYAKGMRDSMQLSLEYGMLLILDTLEREIQGELLSIVLRAISLGSNEMKEIVQEINTIIKEHMRICPSCNIQLLEVPDDMNIFKRDINKRKQKFLATVNDYQKKYIYGAGTLGRRVSTFLKQNNVDIEAFVVSDLKDNPECACNKPVIAVNDIQGKEESFIVIVAVFEYLQDEIVKNLEERNIKNYLCINLKEFNLYDEMVIH